MASRRALVFGGTNFSGRSCVQKLLEGGWKVTLVNRGNEYWGTRNPFTDFADAVTVLKADRTKPKKFANAVIKATGYLDKGSKWDMVVDFSLFRPKEVKGVLTILTGRVDRYVFISSDSVYEVCPRALEKDTPVVESDAVRPKSALKVQELRQEDSYGHQKLECEELLATHTTVDQTVEIVSLRLADVLGPRDDTMRFHATWLWIHYGALNPTKCFPLHDPKNQQKLMFTFSEDVARYVLHLAVRPHVSGLRAVNLCCPEPITLLEFYGVIAGRKDLPTKLGTETFLPSVNRMTPLSVELIRKEGFEPTKLSSCVQTSSDFCRLALRKHPEETLEAITMLPLRVRKAVCQCLGVSVPESSSSESSSS